MYCVVGLMLCITTPHHIARDPKTTYHITDTLRNITPHMTHTTTLHSDHTISLQHLTTQHHSTHTTTTQHHKTTPLHTHNTNTAPRTSPASKMAFLHVRRSVEMLLSLQITLHKSTIAVHLSPGTQECSRRCGRRNCSATVQLRPLLEAKQQTSHFKDKDPDTYNCNN